MKKHYTLLAIAILASSLFSCEKETNTIRPSTPATNLSPQERMDLLDLPAVLFQYAFVNLETGEENGWIIDRAGNLKSYSATSATSTLPSSENENWQEADLSNLYAKATEIVTTIEAEELLNRAHQGLSLSKKSLSATEMNEDAKWVAGFYAFTQKKATSNNHSNDNCYGAANYNSNTTTEIRIKRQIINLSGHINRYETSTYATNLHQWLLDLNEGLQ